MECPRHPGAATHGAHCAACLLEGALGSSEALPRFSIQLPLGETSSGSVLLVRTEPPAVRLLRLKTVRRRAPVAFLERFQELQLSLEAWSEPSVVVPAGAWVDDDGHPWVLSEFRQGMPLLDRVRDRRLPADTGAAMLARLRTVMRTAHRNGLAHGSIVTGNVLVDAARNSACLLDFGFRSLLADSESLAPSAADDEAALDALEQVLWAVGRRPDPVA